MKHASTIVVAACIALAAGCKKSSEPVTVTIEPDEAFVVTSTTFPFTVRVQGVVNQDVTWTLRTIDDLPPALAGNIANGVYVAPADVPFEAQNRVFVRATSVVDPTQFAEARVEITPPPLSPRSGPSDGGIVVGIVSEGLDGGNPPTVSFGNNPVTSIDVINEVFMTVTIPAHPIGIVDVTIDTGTDLLVYPDAFRYGASSIQLAGSLHFPPCQFRPDLAALIDVDGDGLSEIASLCGGIAGSSRLDIAGQQYFLARSGAKEWEIVDVDGLDGPDIVINFGDAVDVLLNLGAPGGSWAGFDVFDTPVPASQQPATGIALGDVIGDAELELAFVVPVNDELILWPGLGGGLFDSGNPTTFATAATPRAAAIGDVDGDMNVDLIAAVEMATTGATSPFGEPGGGLSLFRGAGSDTFMARADSLAVDPPPLYTGRFAPGILDVAVADVEAAAGVEVIARMPAAVATVRWDGAVLLPSQDFPAPLGSEGRLQVGDFDGDASADLMSVALGASTFELGMPPQPYALPLHARSLFLGDIEGDSMIDYVLTGRDSRDTIFVSGNPGAATLFGAPSMSSPTGNRIDSLVRVGEPEAPSLAGAAPDDGAVIIFPLSGGAPLPVVLDTNARITQVRSVDVDSDGFGDLVALNAGAVSPPSLWFLPGGPGGNFGAPREIVLAPSSPVIDGALDIEVVDQDDDGLAELWVSYGVNVNDPQRTGDIGVLNGVERWWDETQVDPAPLGLSEPVDRLIAQDISIDGRPEILAVDSLGGLIHFIFSPEPEERFAFPALNAVSAAATDVNDDFDVDILLLTREVSASTVHANLTLIRSNGTDTGDSVLYRFEGDPRDMAIADLDSDGVEDVLVTTTEPAALVILAGRPSGLGEPQYIKVGTTPSSTVTFDATQDGLADVFVADATEAGLRLLINTSQ